MREIVFGRWYLVFSEEKIEKEMRERISKTGIPPIN